MNDPISSAAKPTKLIHVVSTDPKANPRGSWWWAPITGDTPTTEKTADSHGVMIKCAGCDFYGKISDALNDPPRDDGTHGHAIDAGGVVEPSIRCPKCDWHVFAILEGWVGPDSEDAMIPMPPSAAPEAPAPAVMPASARADIEAKAAEPAPAPVAKVIYQCPQCRATIAMDLEKLAKAHPHSAFRHGNCPVCMKGRLESIKVSMPITVRLKDQEAPK